MRYSDIEMIELDQELLAEMEKPTERDEFMFQVANIFRKTVLSFGVEVSTAEMAMKAFYAARNSLIEESKEDISMINRRLNNEERDEQCQSEDGQHERR